MTSHYIEGNKAGANRMRVTEFYARKKGQHTHLCIYLRILLLRVGKVGKSAKNVLHIWEGEKNLNMALFCTSPPSLNNDRL